jgi:hypothetical protein
MALVVRDRVKTTTTTTGTGTVTLGSPALGFQGFSAIGDGNSTYYTITDTSTGDWEVGLGTYTSSGTTLSRTTVLDSSNGGSLVSFTAGAKDVFVVYPAEKAVYRDAVGDVTVDGSITGTEIQASNGLLIHASTITQNVTVAAGYNVISAGPVVVDATVVITDGVWVVV